MFYGVFTQHLEHSLSVFRAPKEEARWEESDAACFKGAGRLQEAAEHLFGEKDWLSFMGKKRAPPIYIKDSFILMQPDSLYSLSEVWNCLGLLQIANRLFCDWQDLHCSFKHDFFFFNARAGRKLWKMCKSAKDSSHVCRKWALPPFTSSKKALVYFICVISSPPLLLMPGRRVRNAFSPSNKSSEPPLPALVEPGHDFFFAVISCLSTPLAANLVIQALTVTLSLMGHTLT